MSMPPPITRALGWLPPKTQGVPAFIARVAPGTALAGLIALAASSVSTLHGGPAFLYALFLGIAFHYLSDEPRTAPGIDFCSRAVLRLGVGLLGARITAEQIAALGWSTALVVIGAVVSTIAFALLVGRRLGLSKARRVLCGGAVAICGASAALAISAVLPKEKDSEQFTLMTVVTVTVLSTVAMILYPLVAQALGLPPHLAGLFIGGTIHDVAQVIGAGYTLGPATGDVATVVKLFRVAMLAVVVLAVSIAFKARRTQGEDAQAPAPQPLVPWFLWLFVFLVILNSTVALPPLLLEQANTVSRACLMVAIAALGIKTSLQQLSRAGWRPMALILAETLWLALFVLGFALTSSPRLP